MNASFAAYFSHSWNAENLPINLLLWRHIACRCHLVIDQPEPTFEDKRPYFISRMETLMRHADVMICCLPAQKRDVEFCGDAGDWRPTATSPYILFELRLAERLDLPRLVLFDAGSRFQAPPYAPPHVRYIKCKFRELADLDAAGRFSPAILNEIDAWLEWISINRSPSPWTPPSRTAFLLSSHSRLVSQAPLLSQAFDEGGFDAPEPLTSLFQTDAELYQTLRSIGLLIVDVRQQDLWPLYHAAHSLMVPSIRIDSLLASEGPAELPLPMLLRGHPVGYQKDLINEPASQDDLLFQRVRDRALAASRSSRAISTSADGEALLYQRTFAKGNHLVFISHHHRPNERAFVDYIIASLKAKGVPVWEYGDRNQAAENWEKNLDQALGQMTLMVALMGDIYECRPACLKEWNHALSCGIDILPFLVGGRTKASEALRPSKTTHKILSDNLSIEERALPVIAAVLQHLRIHEAKTQQPLPLA